MQTRSFGEVAGGRSNNYDFLRFVFAALVIFAHSFPLIGRGIDPVSWITMNGTYTGDIAVDGFFAISGCLVTASWLRSRGIVDYFKKRALRIYPGFVVASLFCLFVVGPLGARHLGWYFHGIHWFRAVEDLVFLHQVQPVHAFTWFSAQGYLDGPMWSIQLEFSCYILVAILGLIGFYRRRAAVLAAFLITDILYIAFAPQQHAAWRFQYYFDYMRCLTCFLAGMTFYLYRDAIPRSAKLCVAAAALIVGATILHRFDFALVLCGGYLLFYGAYNPRWRMERFGERHDLSYGIYVYGWPMQILLVNWFGTSMSPLVLFALALTLASLCALASWHFVESPALRLKSFSRRKQSVIPTAESHSYALPNPMESPITP